MSANAVVRARIDENIKEEATVVLATMGLTVSDAFRLMLTRVAKEKSLPFDPLIPNAETIEAMKESSSLSDLKFPEQQTVAPASDCTKNRHIPLFSTRFSSFPACFTRFGRNLGAIRPCVSNSTPGTPASIRARPFPDPAT